MENVIRKLSLALVVALCVICLIGCGKKKPKEETGEETSTPGTGVIFQDNGTYTEKYVLLRPEGSKQPLHIYDVETGLLSIYCFDPGCEHKPEKRSLDGETVLEKGCPAYDYITYPVYIKENTMYFFHDNCLWSADVTGQNRKEITRIKRPVYTSNALYTDEALYLTYTTPYEWTLHEENGTSEWIAGEMKEKQEAGVLRIPYSGEGEQIIFKAEDSYDMQVVLPWYHDGCVCFQVQGRDIPFQDIADYAASVGDDWQALMNYDRQHSYTEAFDYVIATGEVKSFAYEKPSRGGFYFFRAAYGLIQESGKLELHKYSGELIGETEMRFGGIVSDQSIIGYNMDTGNAVMLSEETGKMMKTSPLTYDDFTADVIVGETYYGHSLTDGGSYKRAYMKAEDFWAGKKDKIVFYGEKEQ